ncbi:MAG: helix-turn-helix transcriptional regulator [Vulcanisaeta sp. AZ3]
MNNTTSVRSYRFWVGISLMGLVIYLIIKLYEALFLNLRIPVVTVEPDGVLRIIGSIQPFTNPILSYDIILSMILTALLSSLASILIYSSITRQRQNNVTIVTNEHTISSIPLTTMEKKAITLIRKKGGMMTQAELSRELNLSKYQASRLVKRLEAKGIIERRRAGVTNILVLRNSPGPTLNKVSKDGD